MGEPLSFAHRRKMGTGVEWAEDHQDELLQNWEGIKETGEYHKIDPLV